MLRLLFIGFILTSFCGHQASAEESDARFTVEVDKAKILRLPRAASAVIIGNPAIADASVHDGRTLLITGKIFGATNIIVLDGRGNTVIERDIQVRAPQMAAITYYRGGAQRTFTCAGYCELSPSVGDDPDVFDRLMVQQKGKSDQGNEAAE